jgi:hypothetical protein
MTTFGMDLQFRGRNTGFKKLWIPAFVGGSKWG